jgi:hypothetical protein
LSVGIEKTRLDVGGKNVTNCAIPCYFLACYLSGADPPGTYKPCAQARVEAHSATPYIVELELVDALNRVVYQAPAAAAAGGDLLRYVQLQLYSKPNLPLPPGFYTLTARAKDGAEIVAAASIQVRID